MFSYEKLVDAVGAPPKKETVLVAGFAAVAAAPAAVKAQPAQTPLEKAMKSLSDHKDAGYNNKTQLTRKVTTVVQHGAAFKVVDEAMQQLVVAKQVTDVVAKEVMASVASQLGGEFKAGFDKANPPVIPDFLTSTPAAGK